ncbi:hypothetical protein NPIL_232151 [Nephila pilipes]|uniref:Uncharacterized protein n=1 Tax=Nephila pilipes TaxID=299642 RepID=A0A8X6QRK3_NEPPI|nr:hypothetical protein NPIL_232151 [Nephila pilipes]
MFGTKSSAIHQFSECFRKPCVSSNVISDPYAGIRSQSDVWKKGQSEEVGRRTKEVGEVDSRFLTGRTQNTGDRGTVDGQKALLAC